MLGFQTMQCFTHNNNNTKNHNAVLAKRHQVRATHAVNESFAEQQHKSTEDSNRTVFGFNKVTIESAGAAAESDRGAAHTVKQLLISSSSVCVNPAYLLLCTQSDQEAMRAAGLLDNNALAKDQASLPTTPCTSLFNEHRV